MEKFFELQTRLAAILRLEKMFKQLHIIVDECQIDAVEISLSIPKVLD